MNLTAVAPFGFKGFPEDRVFSYLRECGIERVHVVRDYQIKLPAAEIVAFLARYGLRPGSFHADQGEHVDVSSPDDAFRQASLDRLVSEADFSLALGVAEVIVHPCGALGPADPRRSGQFRRSAEVLARAAERRGVRFYVENMPGDHAYGAAVSELVRDLRRTGSEHLGLCFDTGHANLTPRGVEAQLADTDGFIHFIHGHDNDGKGDLHMLPMTGSIDWSAVFSTLARVGFDGTFCLEVFQPMDTMRDRMTPEWWDRLSAFMAGRAA